MPARAAAVIPAAGKGHRLGELIPKAFVELRGVPLLGFSLSAFDAAQIVREIVVAVPPGDREKAESVAREFVSRKTVCVVEGGETRRDSVRSGLGRIGSATEVVVVHDAARPFVALELIDECARSAIEHGAVTTAHGVSDTVKRVRDGVVQETPDRDSLFFTQTPQAFRKDLLLSAHDHSRNRGISVTDDAVLLERLGYPVRTVDSPETNMKVTTPLDLELAGRLIDAGLVEVTGVAAERVRAHSAASPAAAEMRVGFGFDSHRFSAGRKLVLGGVEIEYDRGLLGHSDGDALCHSLCDAILGAASLGDIGVHFPDTDPRYLDAHSLDLLKAVASMAAEAGWAVANLDATVIAQQPRLADYHNMMRDEISRAVGVAPSRISIKAKTAEGMDSLGKGRGLAVHSVALLARVGSR
jgi:2-C-methyl-D-erythritol 4-phosphate cytidylyltransferase/2-C-methyl-D-erythritol 2,4-cyclodiphosphate synthase